MKKIKVDFDKLYQLPAGWEWCPLEELIGEPKRDIVDGPFGSNLKASEYQNEGIPIARLQNIDRNAFLYKNIKFISKKKAASLSRHDFRTGDILITKLGAPLGKACIVPESIKQGVIVADLVRVRVNGGMDTRYLTYVINSPFLIRQFEKHTKGTTRPRVNLGIIRRLPIPVAPLKQQKLIVAEIEKQFSRLDEAVAGLKHVKANLKRYKAAVLKAAVEGKLTEEWRDKQNDVDHVNKLYNRILHERAESTGWLNVKGHRTEDIISELKNKSNSYQSQAKDDLATLPKQWMWIKSEFIFYYITSGSRGWAKYYSNAGPLFLRMGNLDHDSISLDMGDVQRVKLPKQAEGLRTRIQDGDILISITADVGMIALIPAHFEEAYINQHIALARPVNAINKKYLAWFLACQDGGQLQFKKMQRGATKVGLGLDDIRSIDIPLPSLEEQGEIVRKIEQLYSFADETDKTIDRNIKQAAILRQRILKEAFEGRLVPQDPTDEPASMFLNKLQQEKLKSTSAKVEKMDLKDGEVNIMKLDKSKKQLLEIVSKYPKGLAPDKLLSLANYTIDEVDDFYAELYKIAGQLTQIKPSGKDALRWPYESKVILRLKG